MKFLKPESDFPETQSVFQIFRLLRVDFAHNFKRQRLLLKQNVKVCGLPSTQ